MRILVTGASGFLGRNMLKKLSNTNHSILATSRLKDNRINFKKSFEWVYGDLSDTEFIKKNLVKFNPEVLIHLAWSGIPNYSDYLSSSNLYNSINLFREIISNTNCKKILVSGSCWEYGKKFGSCNESDSERVDSYFNWAKNSMLKYLSFVCNEKNIDYHWFRIFFVFGLGQKESALIPTLINSIKQKNVPHINFPQNKNDFVFVDDVINIFYKSIENNLQSGVYNIGSGISSSVLDISKIVEKKILGTDTISSIVEKNGSDIEKVNFWSNMEKTSSNLNLSSPVKIEVGINQIINDL